MAMKMRRYLMESLAHLRFEHTSRRIRVCHGPSTLVDTTSALLFWEPRRIVAVYAVPEDALDATLVPNAAPAHALDDLPPATSFRLDDPRSRRIRQPGLRGVHVAGGGRGGTICAYKGHASYYSVKDAKAASRDIAWTYPEPLHDAEHVRDLVCFFSERTDLS
jgi:uncharacterized protein (DUF427 family)